MSIFSPHSNLQYIDEEGKEHYHTLKGYPKYLEKKVTLLKHFLTYMNDHLLKVFTKKNCYFRVKCLSTWLAWANENQES